MPQASRGHLRQIRITEKSVNGDVNNRTETAYGFGGVRTVEAEVTGTADLGGIAVGAGTGDRIGAVLNIDRQNAWPVPLPRNFCTEV